MTGNELMDFCFMHDVELKFELYETDIDKAENPCHLKVKMKRAYRTYPVPEGYDRTIFFPKMIEDCSFSALKPMLEEMVAELANLQLHPPLRESPVGAIMPSEPVYVVWEIPNYILAEAAHSRITNLKYLQQLNCNDFASLLFDLIWCRQGQDTNKCGSCRLNECECCLDYGSLVKWLKEEREE